MPSTDEFIVTGPTPGAPNYLDWANLLNRWPVTPAPTYTPPSEAFAPPVPTPAPAPPPPVVLPEVIVEPTPVPIVPLITPAIAGAGAGLLGLLFPTAIGGGNLPDNATQWRPPKDPPASAHDAGDDAPQPPDWGELSEGFDVWGDRIERGAEFLRDVFNTARRVYGLLDRFKADPVSRFETGTSKVLRISDNPLLEEFVVQPKRTVKSAPRAPALQEVPLVDYQQLFRGLGSDFGLGFELAPVRTPRIDTPARDPSRKNAPGRRTGLEPSRALEVDLFGAPHLAPDGGLFFDPTAPSDVPVPPRIGDPVPRTPVDTTPAGFIDDVVPNLYPPPDLAVAPIRVPPRKGDCTCTTTDGGGPKKKKKKKRADRAICYRGTYRQLKRGISYSPKEEVPCDARSREESSRSKKSGSGKKPGTTRGRTARGSRRGSSPSIGDLARDVFGIPFIN